MTKRPLPPGYVPIPSTAKCVFKGKIFDVYQWEQELYDGSTQTFEMLKRPDTIAVIGVVDDQVVLIEQEQPSKPLHWTIPAGRVDEGEDPLTTAQREMREETGMTFAKWELKSIHQVHTKFDWLVYTFVAQDLIKEEPQSLDAGERIRVEKVPYSRLVELVKQREMRWNELLVNNIINGRMELQDILVVPTIDY